MLLSIALLFTNTLTTEWGASWGDLRATDLAMNGPQPPDPNNPGLIEQGDYWWSLMRHDDRYAGILLGDVKIPPSAASVFNPLERSCLYERWQWNKEPLDPYYNDLKKLGWHQPGPVTQPAFRK